MNKNRITFSFKNSEKQILYKVELEVMALNRDEKSPKALLHFDIVAYDLSKRKNVVQRKFFKEDTYKKLFQATSRDDDFAIISREISTLEEKIQEKIEALGFSLHELYLELYISSAVERIREDYIVKKSVCVPL